MPGVAAVNAIERAVARVVSLARNDPVLAAAVAVAALSVLVAIALSVRRWRRTTGDAFERALGDVDAVTLLMHPNPDPDAMACAAGIARLAEGVNTDAEIRYPGQIRHQENRAFRTVLDLGFERIEDAAALDGTPVVLVDHNEPRGFDGCGRVRPYAVVDHHPGGGSGASFTDVRADYGACATLVAEYYRELGYRPEGADDAGVDGDRVLPSAVATALLYGIISDTNDFTRGCTDAEFRASAYLYPGIDGDALDRIANPPVDAVVLDAIATAIAERDVRGPFAVSDVGTLSNLDAIPQAADELLQLEGVTAVVVVGDKDDSLHLSGRSRDDRVHMGDALAAAVDDVPMSSAGGHARMGGGQVSMTHLEGLRPGSGMSRSEFIDRLFDCLAGDA